MGLLKLVRLFTDKGIAQHTQRQQISQLLNPCLETKWMN